MTYFAVSLRVLAMAEMSSMAMEKAQNKGLIGNYNSDFLYEL